MTDPVIDPEPESENDSGSASSAARMLLVRHGESTWNAIRRWQGQADPPLSERGERQADAAVDAARASGPFELIVTSSLRRARQTGERLATGLRVPMLAPADGLRERHAGDWQGLTRVEINDRYPGFLVDGRRPAGYETDDEIIARSSATLRTLAAEHGGATMLVVSHGGVINALERHDGDSWQRLDNIEGRWFDVADEIVRAVGDRVHLIEDRQDRSIDRSYA